MVDIAAWVELNPRILRIKGRTKATAQEQAAATVDRECELIAGSANC